MESYDKIKKTTAETYDAIAQFFAPLLTEENASTDEIKAVDEFIELLSPNARVADLGCGVGKHGRYCAKVGIEKKRGFIVCGYDISRKMIELAEYYNSVEGYPKIEVLKFADMCTFTVKEEEKYDAIMMAYSLIHLDKQHAEIALEHLKTVINHGAYLFITVYRGTRDDYQVEECNDEYQMYYRDYLEDEFHSLVENAGYEVIDSTEFKDTDPISGGAVSFDTGVLCIIAKYK